MPVIKRSATSVYMGLKADFLFGIFIRDAMWAVLEVFFICFFFVVVVVVVVLCVTLHYCLLFSLLLLCVT